MSVAAPLFRRILVQVEPALASQPALDRATRLAASDGVELTLVDVVEPPPAYARVLLGTRLESSLLEDRQAALAAVAHRVAESGVQVSAEILTGNPAVALIQEVMRGSHDLLLRSHAAAPSASADQRFGPIDMRLLRKCPCPVWLEQPSRAGGSRRILVAVDPMPQDSSEEGLATVLLEFGFGLAAIEESELRVLHAWLAFGEHVLRSHMRSEELDAYVEAARQRASSALDGLLAPYEGRRVQPRVELLKGEPGRVIPEVVRTEGVDLVVMGTIARAGIPGLVIGNTAERILTELSCSVLAIKPAGFISPICPDQGGE